MSPLRTSGRVDEAAMRDLVAAAARQVARAYGIDAGAVGDACAATGKGVFVRQALEVPLTIRKGRG